MKILNFLSGKKTFIIGLCAIVYGIWQKDPNAILIGSAAAGLRQGLYTLEQNILTVIYPNPTVTSGPVPTTSGNTSPILG